MKVIEKDVIKIFYNSSHPNISYLKNNLNRKVKFIKYDVFSVEENYKFKKISYINFIFKFFTILFLPLIFLYQQKKNIADNPKRKS